MVQAAGSHSSVKAAALELEAIQGVRTGAVPQVAPSPEVGLGTAKHPLLAITQAHPCCRKLLRSIKTRVFLGTCVAGQANSRASAERCRGAQLLPGNTVSTYKGPAPPGAYTGALQLGKAVVSGGCDG